MVQGNCCGGSGDGKCCMDQRPKGCQTDDSQPDTIEGTAVLFDSSKFIPLDPTQEVIFPPALRVTLDQ